MSIFKELAAFIGWLSGSLAGIGAILYACGYLITRAHLHMLGIDALYEYSNEHYMQEGAKFFVVMADLAGRISLPLLVTLGAGVILIALVASMIFAVWYFVRGRKGVQDTRDAWTRGRAGITGFYEERLWLWRGLLFSVALILLLYIAETDLPSFSIPLSVSDLLFRSGDDASATAGGTEAQVLSWLVSGDTESLKNSFIGAILSVMKAGILLLLAWRASSPWRFRALVVSPFVIVFMVFLILLPMVYGVLMRPARFARVSIESESRMLADRPAGLFLLNKTDNEFVLWDSARRQVLWIPAEEVKGARVEHVQFLFTRQ